MKFPLSEITGDYEHSEEKFTCEPGLAKTLRVCGINDLRDSHYTRARNRLLGSHLDVLSACRRSAAVRLVPQVGLVSEIRQPQGGFEALPSHVLDKMDRNRRSQLTTRRAFGQAPQTLHFTATRSSASGQAA